MISYALYFHEPPSRNLERKVDPETAALKQAEEIQKIHYLVESMVEDLRDLIPAGYSIEYSKEEQ